MQIFLHRYQRKRKISTLWVFHFCSSSYSKLIQTTLTALSSFYVPPRPGQKTVVHAIFTSEWGIVHKKDLFCVHFFPKIVWKCNRQNSFSSLFLDNCLMTSQWTHDINWTFTYRRSYGMQGMILKLRSFADWVRFWGTGDIFSRQRLFPVFEYWKTCLNFGKEYPDVHICG